MGELRCWRCPPQYGTVGVSIWTVFLSYNPIGENLLTKMVSKIVFIIEPIIQKWFLFFSVIRGRIFMSK